MGCLTAFAAGCVIDATPTRGPYEACNAGDFCSNGTSCSQAMYSVSGAPGNRFANIEKMTVAHAAPNAGIPSCASAANE